MRNFKPFAVAALLVAGLSGLASAQAAAPTGASSILPSPPPPATYEPAGRRDPFKNLLAGKNISERRVITGLSDLMIDEVTIIGLVKNKGRFEAVIGMASGFPISAHEGDRFADGFVLSVNDTQAVLRKTHERGIPLLKPKDIVKEITSEER